MKTEILSVHGNWKEVLNLCRHTVNKEDLNKEPSDQFKRSILIAEHSPIRALTIVWRWTHMKYWVTNHWVRHKWECFVRTQRTDRTNVDRDSLPQSAEVEFIGMANAQSLIDTMRKRLCFMAANETRKSAIALRNEIAKVEPDVAKVLVPNCVYRCGCPEIGGGCHWFNESCANDPRLRSIDINERYEAYNRYRSDVQKLYDACNRIVGKEVKQ